VAKNIINQPNTDVVLALIPRVLIDFILHVDDHLLEFITNNMADPLYKRSAFICLDSPDKMARPKDIQNSAVGNNTRLNTAKTKKKLVVCMFPVILRFFA